MKNNTKQRGKLCECKRNALEENQEWCSQCEFEIDEEIEVKNDYWLTK